MPVERVLLFHNPGFESDMEAIIAAAPAGVEIRTYSTVDIGEHFLRLFPQQVLGLDLSLYHGARFQGRRERWAQRARSLVRELHATFPFDLAVAPADDTPYWHDVALGIEELGVPFILMFKEATHPPGQLRTTASAVRRWAPVTARHVFVNTEMTKTFVVACGADPMSVRVIGQPRFDAYAPERSRGRDRPPSRTVLFLSYEADAYQSHEQRLAHQDELERYLRAGPEAASERTDLLVDTWLPLRVGTERALLEAAALSGRRVVVKPHPQMDPADLAFDRRHLEIEAARTGGSFEYLDPRSPVRPVLLAADIVVGFQTTVLLEGMALDKHTIYAAWGDRLDERDDRLIPFAQWGDAITVARSPSELRDAASAAMSDDERRVARRRELAEEWLGPLDGKASSRLWEGLARIAAARPRRADEVARRGSARIQLRDRRGEERAAAVREVLCAGAARAFMVFGSVPGARSGARAFARMAERARRRRLECRGVVTGPALAGPFAAPLAIEILDGVLGRMDRALHAR